MQPSPEYLQKVYISRQILFSFSFVPDHWFILEANYQDDEL